MIYGWWARLIITRDGGIPLLSHAYAGDRPVAEENVQKTLTVPELVSIKAVREGRVAAILFGLTALSIIAIEGLEQLADQFKMVR